MDIYAKYKNPVGIQKVPLPDEVGASRTVMENGGSSTMSTSSLDYESPSPRSCWFDEEDNLCVGRCFMRERNDPGNGRESQDAKRKKPHVAIYKWEFDNIEWVEADGIRIWESSTSDGIGEQEESPTLQMRRGMDAMTSGLSMQNHSQMSL